MPIKDLQVTNKQHAVPQNIMDVEFKLIGDLTMRQFAYLMVMGGLAWGTYTLLGGIFKWPFVILFSLLGLGLAFFTVADRGLDQWIMNFFRSMYSPNQKVWKKDPVVPSIFMYQNIALVKQELITLAPTSSRRKLEEYLEYQGKSMKVDRLDIPEQEYINKVREAFENAPEVSSASVSANYQYQEPGASLASSGDLVSGPGGVSVAVEEPLVSLPQEPPLPVQQATKVPAQQLPQSHQSQPQSQQQPQIPYEKPKTPSQELEKKVPQEKAKVEESQIQKSKATILKSVLHMPSRKGLYIPLTPLTPDRHSGRVFTSLLPDQGVINLPIRGERVLKTSEEEGIEQDIEVKTEQLNKLIEQIKTSEGYRNVSTNKTVESQTASTASQPAPQLEKLQNKPISLQQQEEILVKNEAENVVETMKAENARLAQEIEKLKTEAQQGSQNEQASKQQELVKLQEQREHVSTDFSTLQATIRELEQKLREKSAVSSSAFAQALKSGIQYTQASYAKMQPITSMPNIISGLVKNLAGTVLEGIVLIIKNQKGEPVRALKTNSLGQFAISTPLANGRYTIEVDASKKTGQAFDIIFVDAKGDLLPPIEFVGK